MENRPRLALAVLWSLVAPVKAQDPVTPLRILEGRVVDLRGDGVPVAKVVVVNSIDETVLARTVADGEGFFKLKNVPRVPRLEARATADGFCEGRGHVSDSESVTVEMQHAVTLRGVLRNRESKPVAQVVVQARVAGRSMYSVRAEAVTAADGTFVIERVPIGPVALAAYVAGDGLAMRSLHVRAAATVELQTDASPRTDLEVAVTGLPPDGGPSVRLRLLPYSPGHLVPFPPPLDFPVLDAAGAWTGRALPTFEYLITPIAAGFSFVPREIRVKPGDPRRVEFAATPIGPTGVQCPAIARDGEGRPVRGVSFELRAYNSSQRATATSDAEGELVFSSPLGVGEKGIVYATGQTWVVDPQLRNVDPPPGLFDPRFSKVQHVVVDPNATIELRVIPACNAAGRLLLADGRPAAFVSVQLQQAREGISPPWAAMAYATTNRDGRWHIHGVHHVPAELRVLVEDQAGTWASETFHLDAPGTTIALPEVSIAPPASIEGRVLDAHREPVPGIRVWLRDWDMAEAGSRTGNIVERITDRDGRYRFRGVPPGGAMLQVLPGSERGARERNAAEPIEVEAGKTHTVDLDWR